jgi:ankyrin repeat protein
MTSDFRHASSNRIYLAATVLVFILVAVVWRRMLQPIKDQVERARRDGITVQGGDPAPLQPSVNPVLARRNELRNAAEQGLWAPIERRLAAGMRPDDPVDARTLLMIAAQHGRVELIGQLCRKGSKVDTRDAHGNTALLYAVRYGSTAAARWLHQHGAQLTVRNEFGMGVIDLAMIGQQQETYAYLRDHGVKINLVQAIQMQDRKTIDALLNQGVDVNAVYPTVYLHTDQVQPGSLQSVQTPVNLPPSDPDHGLQWIVSDKTPNPADMYCHLRPLESAFETADWDVAERLIAHGAQINAVGQTQMTYLMSAAWNGNLELVRFLLRHGARADLLSYEQKTALDYARGTGNLNREIVALLLQAQMAGK